MRWYLSPISILFRFIVFIRNKLFDLGLLESKKYNLPIISIGNITVGGTGKTPHAEYLIDWLCQKYKLVLLSRGYKRETKGFFEVLPNSSVSQSGDEPLQIRQKYPNIRVVVDENRVHAIDKILNEPNAPELIILDDAFQHRHVNPGLKILLIDYHRPISHDFMLPMGRLREPAKNSRRADIVIITKCPFGMMPIDFNTTAKRMQLNSMQKLFFTMFQYGEIKRVFDKMEISEFPNLKESSALVVTGIANPLPFYEKIEELGATLYKMSFPDHHKFTETDCYRIVDRYMSMPAAHKYIITTEKDAIRLRSNLTAKYFVDLPIYYIPISVKFLHEGEEKFKNRIEEYLAVKV